MTEVERVHELDRLYLRAKDSDDPDDWAAYLTRRDELKAELGMTPADEAREVA